MWVKPHIVKSGNYEKSVGTLSRLTAPLLVRYGLDYIQGRIKWTRGPWQICDREAP